MIGLGLVASPPSLGGQQPGVPVQGPMADSVEASPVVDSLAAPPAVLADAPRPVDPLGPLRVAERNPLYHLFLTPTVEGTRVLDGGAWRVGVSTAYSNIFEVNYSDDFEQRFDLERSTTVLALSRGIGGAFELGASVGVQHNWGGFLDPAIQELHGLFGLPNADREKVENGAFGVFLLGRWADELVFLDLPSGTGLEAPRLWAAWRVAGSEQGRGALTLRSTVKLPLGDHRASSRGTDVALEMAARRSWGPTHLHASGGFVRFGRPARLAPIMHRSAWYGSVGLERRVAEAVALLVQFHGGSRYASGFGFGELDNLPLNLSVGARGRLGHSWEWQVSFTEDVPPNSPSVDFTLDLGLARTWAPGMGPRRDPSPAGEATGDPGSTPRH